MKTHWIGGTLVSCLSLSIVLAGGSQADATNVYALLIADNSQGNADLFQSGVEAIGLRLNPTLFNDASHRLAGVIALGLPQGPTGQPTTFERMHGTGHIDARLMSDFTIVNALNQLPTMGDGDALFCFYAAHGGQLPAAAAGVPNVEQSAEHFYGHFLQTGAGEQILRYNLWGALKGKKAGLTVLLSDTCFRTNQAIRSNAAGAPAPATAPPNALKHLLCDFRGDVNITATNPLNRKFIPAFNLNGVPVAGGYGELALIVAPVGSNFRGIFTTAALGSIDSSNDLSWADFHIGTRATTESLYRQNGGAPYFNGQETQRPTDFILSVTPR